MKAEDKNTECLILEAAEKLFLEQGLTKTTTGQIAKLAGCNQALVHYYYRTKDNLFDKVFEEKIRLMASNMLTISTTGITLEERVKKMIETHFNFLKQNPKLVAFVLNEINSNPDRLFSLADKLQQYPKSVLLQLESDLNNEIEKGTIRPISAIDLILTIISLNVTLFLFFPIFQKVLNLSDESMQEVIENRKKEIINTIMIRLRK